MAKTKTAAKTRLVSAGRKNVAPPRKPVDPVDLRLAAVQRAVLGSTAVLAAIAVWRPMLDPFMLPKLTVLMLGAVALLVLAGVRAVRLSRLSVPTGTAVWIAVALAAALVLATVTASNVGIAVAGQQRRSAGLLSYLSYLVIFLVALRLYAGREPRGLVKAFLLSLGLVSAYGLFQVAGWDPYTWSSGGLAQTFSTMGNVNFAAGYVGMVTPAAAAVVVFPGWSPAWRIGAGSLVVVAAVYLVANGSSQGPIAASAGLAVVGAAWWSGRRRPQASGDPSTSRRPWLLPLAGLLGVLGAGVLAVRLGPGLLDSFSERRYFWRAALGIFADNPLLGSGLESFRDNFTRYRAPEHAVSIGFDGADSPHSVPLGMLAAGGLPLVLAYLAFVGYTGWALVRGLLAAVPGQLPTLAAFGGMWTAYQVQSLVSVDVPAVTLPHFVSAGLVLAVTRTMTTRSVALPLSPASRGAFLPRGAAGTRSLTAATLAVVVLLGLSTGWLATRPLRADLAAGGAQEQADVADRVQELDKAVRLAPWEAEYRLMQGRALIEAGDTERAFGAALAAAELRRGSSKLALGVADFAKKRGDQATADFWVAEALRRDPVNPALLEELAVILRAEGKPAEADALVQRAASLRAEHADF